MDTRGNKLVDDLLFSFLLDGIISLSILALPNNDAYIKPSLTYVPEPLRACVAKHILSPLF